MSSSRMKSLRKAAKHGLVVMVCLVSVSMAFGEIASVTAAFSQESVPNGQSVQYLIKITAVPQQGEPEPRLNLDPEDLPFPDGLEVLGPVRGHQIQVVNGHTVLIILTGFEVRAQVAGTYTVEEHVVEIDGDPWAVPAASLEVIKVDRGVELALQAPREFFYVGERVPLDLQLWFRDGVSVSLVQNLPPQVETDNFSVAIAEGYHMSETVRDDQNWRVATWPTAVTPLKVGEFDLPFELMVDVTRPLERRRRSMFGRSLFDDFFADRQRVHLYAEETSWPVRNLPREGKPTEFSGAIGQFQAVLGEVPATIEMGQPLTLEMRITGEGNFARINPPLIDPGTAWRSFDAESDYTPEGPLELRGIKTIRYTLVPRQAGTLELPDIAFNYFDPKEAVYHELLLEGPVVEVSPAPVAPLAAMPAVAPSPEPGLERGLLSVSGVERDLFHPLAGSPVFWTVNGALLVVFGVLVGRERHRRYWDHHPRLRWQRHCHAQAAAALLRARSAEAAATAWTEAAEALRWIAARNDADQQSPKALTPAETLAALDLTKWSEKEADAVREILAQDEALRYGRQRETRSPQTALDALPDFALDS